MSSVCIGFMDATGSGRANNPVDLDVELTGPQGCEVFTVSATVWSPKRARSIMGGQCLGSIDHVRGRDELFQEIKALWQKYHLNNLHAGTIA
jgi:hypothetical protein